MVEIDDLYFQMTGGGVTFGGGEPLLCSDFIYQFCKIANPAWKVRIETSLYVPWENIAPLLNYVDLWLIDVKDMNETIYREYTGKKNDLIVENLIKLEKMLPQEKMIIRVPFIPEYNTEEDIEKSLKKLRAFKNIDRMTYFT